MIDKMKNILKKENSIIATKTLTYKLTSSFITFLMAWGATGSATAGGIFAIVRGLIGLVWYAVHEKIWFFIMKIIKRDKNEL